MNAIDPVLVAGDPLGTRAAREHDFRPETLAWLRDGADPWKDQ